MAGTAVQTLAVARRNLGVYEGKNNSNPFAAIAGHANNQPWCATYVVACLVVAKVLKKGAPSAYCPSLMEANLPKIARAQVRPGDVGLLYFASMGRVAHAVFVEAVYPNYFVTLEGNSNDNGSREGRKVVRRKRSYKGFTFVRPDYAAPAPVKPKPVAPGKPAAKPKGYPMIKWGSRGQTALLAQKLLAKKGYKISIDADFGDQTRAAVVKFQEKTFGKGSPQVDGIIGPKTWTALGAYA